MRVESEEDCGVEQEDFQAVPQRRTGIQAQAAGHQDSPNEQDPPRANKAEPTGIRPSPLRTIDAICESEGILLARLARPLYRNATLLRGQEPNSAVPGSSFWTLEDNPVRLNHENETT